jgi:hypothetical protein
MKASKKEVLAFLKEFGTPTAQTPDDSAELYMDDHICVKYNGIEYYVRENSMMYTEWQMDLVDMLKEKYHV